MMLSLVFFAEFEHKIRAERQAEGIRKAHANGVRLGRKAIFTRQNVDDIQRLRKKEKYTYSQLMNKYCCSKMTIRRALKNTITVRK